MDHYIQASRPNLVTNENESISLKKLDVAVLTDYREKPKRVNSRKKYLNLARRLNKVGK